MFIIWLCNLIVIVETYGHAKTLTVHKATRLNLMLWNFRIMLGSFLRDSVRHHVQLWSYAPHALPLMVVTDRSTGL